MLSIEGSHRAGCTLPARLSSRESCAAFRGWPSAHLAQKCVRRERTPSLRCLGSPDARRCPPPCGGASTSGRGSAWQTREPTPQHIVRGSRVSTAAAGEGGSCSTSDAALNRARQSLAARRAGPTAGKRAPKSAPKGKRVRQADKPRDVTPFQGTKPVRFDGQEEQKVSAQRLSKVLAAAGVASRRASEELIFSGAVTVNGKRCLLPQTAVHPVQDQVTVNGKPIFALPQKKYYFALNKPKGCLCSNTPGSPAEGGSNLVTDLFSDWLRRWAAEHPRDALLPRLFTVGRLDVASVGLIYVTNDGAWAQRVMHPSAGLTREYVATVDEAPTRKQLAAIAAGTVVDGAFVQPALVGADVSDPTHGGRKLRVVVSEGRNREVRTLIGAVGLNVIGLKRVRIGGFRLPRTLGFGQFVPLKPNDIRRVLDRGICTQYTGIQ